MFIALNSCPSFYVKLYWKVIYGNESRMAKFASNIIRKAKDGFKARAQKIFAKISSVIGSLRSSIQSSPSEKKAMLLALVILDTAASGRRTSPTCVVPPDMFPCSVIKAYEHSPAFGIVWPEALPQRWPRRDPAEGLMVYPGRCFLAMTLSLAQLSTPIPPGISIRPYWSPMPSSSGKSKRLFLG